MDPFEPSLHELVPFYSKNHERSEKVELDKKCKKINKHTALVKNVPHSGVALAVHIDETPPLAGDVVVGSG